MNCTNGTTTTIRPLLCAASQCHSGIVDYLLENINDIDPVQRIEAMEALGKSGCFTILQLNFKYVHFNDF